MFNNDADYARSRIVSSYMKGKDKKDGLYKILDIRGRSNRLDEAVIYTLNSDFQEKQLKINQLNFSPGTLGYVNDRMSGSAMFVSRVPIRRDFRQGLRSSQLCYIRNGSSNFVTEQWFELNIKGLSRCLSDDYPPLSHVIEEVEEANIDMAFSKNFALSNKYKLLYKGFVIGDLTKNDTFKLQTSFNFVEEEFAKEVGNDKLSR